MKELGRYFDLEKTAGGRGRCEIKGLPEGSKAAVRTAFWADFDESEKVAVTLLTKTFADTMHIVA
jgi:hypothetical protein